MDARRLKVLAFKAVSLLFLLLVCCTVIAQGLRSMNSLFSSRLAKFPGLRFLQRWEGWHRLDVANVIAVALLLIEYVVLVTAVRYFLVPSTMEGGGDWKPENDRALTWTGFVGLVLGEAFLFYLGVMNNESGWDEGGSLSVALAGSLVYTLSIVFVAYLTVRLERRS